LVRATSWITLLGANNVKDVQCLPVFTQIWQTQLQLRRKQTAHAAGGIQMIPRASGHREMHSRLRLSRPPGSQPGKILTTVIPKLNEPVEVALRRFRRSIENTGLIKELRARMAYETPTAKRKRKKAAAVSRLRKQIRRSLPPKKLY
jgi:small subunit ribosomal protein S21